MTMLYVADSVGDMDILAIKCQIDNKKSQTFLNTNLDHIEKTGGYLARDDLDSGLFPKAARARLSAAQAW